MQSTNGLSGMVQAGQDGNMQNMMAAGVGAAGNIANNYNPQTGQVIQNAGGQFVNAAGQIQDGNYVAALNQAGAATGTAVGGDVGMTVAQSFDTASNMIQSGMDQNYGQMVGQGFAGTG